MRPEALPNNLDGTLICIGYSWPYNARVLIVKSESGAFDCHAFFILPTTSFTVGPEPLPANCPSLDDAKTDLVNWLHGNVLRSMMAAWEPIEWETVP